MHFWSGHLCRASRFFFFFNDTATTEIYTLSLHDALPILNLAELDLEAGRLLEAEAELRRAEQVAIGGHVIRPLAQIYTLMGRLRGAQGDETGVVFFQQAIELAQTLERSLATQAQGDHAH